MASRVDFVLGIHCHQPVGNFDDVIEDAFQRSYRPFIDALEKHAAIKAVAHYTGPLWEFFEAHHPEFIQQLQGLVARGQLELLGGGFYEPILAVLPERDALGQLRMLSDYLEDRFHQRPEGMWVGERVWEPHLPALLNAAGIGYTALDDFHFRRAGVDPNQLCGRFLTEDQGKSLAVFPISGTLRYLVPFRPVEDVMAHFRQTAESSPQALLTLLDDGEKFGVWPGTYDWVYNQGWLERFFSSVEENADWLRTMTLSEAVAERRALGTVYLPTSSYFELTEWALPVHMGRQMEELTMRLGEEGERLRPLLAGGTWRNFLTKYPEVNHMHKRMLLVSQRLHRLMKIYGETSALSNARTALYRAQCNDAYWHGLFGGAYLPHLRDGIFRQLIEAEVRMDEADARRSSPDPEIQQTDLDVDGQTETIVTSKRWWACVRTEGGLLTELDDKRHRFNVLNTIARREELYHRQVLGAASDDDFRSDDGAVSIHEIRSAKQPDLDRFLIYDRRRRAAMHDLFFARGTSLDELTRDPDAPLVDWSTAPHEVDASAADALARVTASHRGPVEAAEIELTKHAVINDDGLDVEVNLANVAEATWDGVYGLEFNLALLAGEAPDRFVLVNGQRPAAPGFAGQGQHEDVSSVRFVNEYDRFAIELSFDDPVSVWRYPVHTVNNSESGFELVYQATALLIRWPMSLGPNESVSRRLTYRVRSL